jgi:hypothetical protein
LLSQRRVVSAHNAAVSVGVASIGQPFPRRAGALSRATMAASAGAGYGREVEVNW